MARPRKKLWSSLSRDYRDRASRLAADYGLTRRQARERYNRGTFQPFARDKVPFKTKPRFVPKPRHIPPKQTVIPDGSGRFSKATNQNPPGPFDNDKQRRAFKRVMSWFPNDGYYLINGKRYAAWPKGIPFSRVVEPSYHSSAGISWHPGGELGVYVRCLSFTSRELDSILDMSREDFRAVASSNMKFWYH